MEPRRLLPKFLAETVAGPVLLESSVTSSGTDRFLPENAGKSINSALNGGTKAEFFT